MLHSLVVHDPLTTSEGSPVFGHRYSRLTVLFPVLLLSCPACSQEARRPDAEIAAPDDAAFVRHAAALRKKYAEHGFSVVIQKPFVVLGDDTEAKVKRWATSTIAWAVTKLKQDYFQKDPDHIIDVWLFKDNVSYRKHLKEFFNEDPGTPFGYYSSHHRCLFMNISTGGGTLVHEIVHPYIAANFPGCPAWFNEGLASLYEQCGEEQGRIHGYTNWRLPALQKAFQADTAPSLHSVLAMSTTKFYMEDKGTNYAQARYLCYYLQEKGQLVKFYKEFVAAQRHDPTGERTLQKVLDEKDFTAFEKKWRAFVMKLEFTG